MLLLSLGTTGLVALLRSGERGSVGDPVPLMTDQWAEMIAEPPTYYDDRPAFPAHFQTAK
jgi:hypothetical protein